MSYSVINGKFEHRILCGHSHATINHAMACRKRLIAENLNWNTHANLLNNKTDYVIPMTITIADAKVYAQIKKNPGITTRRIAINLGFPDDEVAEILVFLTWNCDVLTGSDYEQRTVPTAKWKVRTRHNNAKDFVAAHPELAGY